MGNEAGEGRIDHRPACLPAQDDRLLTVVETLGGRARKMREGILVAADQGEKIPPRGEVKEMPSGEAKDVGKTLHGGFACFEELDGIGTPVHLSLKPGLCFEAGNGRYCGSGSPAPKPIPEDTDAAVITNSAEFFKEPLTGNARVFLQKKLERILKGIEFSGPPGWTSPLIRQQNIMSLIPQLFVPSQDAPHHVAANGKMPGKRPDRPAILRFHDNQPLL